MNDTKSTPLVTSLLDLHKSTGSSVITRQQFAGKADFPVQVRFYDGRQFSLVHRIQKPGYIKFLAVADHQIHTGNIGTSLGIHFCITSGHHHPGFRVLSNRFSDLLPRLAIRFGGNGTGIDDVKVRRFCRTNAGVFLLMQFLGNELGFKAVNLATHGSKRNPTSLGSRRGGSRRGGCHSGGRHRGG